VGKEERDRIQALVRRGRGGHDGRGSNERRAMRRSGPDVDPVTMPAARPPREPAQTKLF
jgi:hypothetical protein